MFYFTCDHSFIEIISIFIRRFAFCSLRLSAYKMESICAKPEVCRDFLRHACTRGSRCRFRHESTSGTDRSTSGGRSHCYVESGDDEVGKKSAADTGGGDADDDVITGINTPEKSM